jgi:toxin ParE1/3/4
MNYSVSWTARSLDRLRSILDYIAEDNPDAALGMVDRISERVSNLSQTPEQGSLYRESALEGLRQIYVRPYRVVYLVDHAGERVRVMAIQHVRECALLPQELLEDQE